MRRPWIRKRRPAWPSFLMRSNRKAHMAKEETGYIVHYEHTDCPVQPGITWDGQWSCMCDDQCPACGADIQASGGELDGTKTQAELDAYNGVTT